MNNVFGCASMLNRTEMMFFSVNSKKHLGTYT